MKRLRITFAKGEELRYISHLDQVRVWERLLRRAMVPLAFSKGFNPHPKIAIAAPLAVGVCGEAEIVDIVVEDDIAPELLRTTLEPQMPDGLRLVDVAEVPLDEPALQARLSFAEFSVDLAPSLGREDVERRIAGFLAATSIERRRRTAADKGKRGGKRAGGTQTYDLRRLVEAIWLEQRGEKSEATSIDESGGPMRLWMRLKAGPGSTGTGSTGTGQANGAGGVGRPDEVLEALDLSQYAEHVRRTKLMFASNSPEPPQATHRHA